MKPASATSATMPRRTPRSAPMRGRRRRVAGTTRLATLAVGCLASGVLMAGAWVAAAWDSGTLELIADIAHRLNQVLAQLRAQPADVDVDDICRRVEVVAPDLREQ